MAYNNFPETETSSEIVAQLAKKNKITIYAGPCLLNDNQLEIEDCFKTAEFFSKLNSTPRSSFLNKIEIKFRCKLFGGGTNLKKFKPGIRQAGVKILQNVRNIFNIKIGCDISTPDEIEYLSDFDFIWIGARNSQNYNLLEALKYLPRIDKKEILIKRGPGMTIEEIIGIHDICVARYGYEPVIIERGINTFCRSEARRWMPDFQGLLRILTERFDIKLCFDPSHACGQRIDVAAMTRAAFQLGVKNFMVEVMNDPTLSQTDKDQILSTEDFEKYIYYWLLRRDIPCFYSDFKI